MGLIFPEGFNFFPGNFPCKSLGFISISFTIEDGKQYDGAVIELRLRNQFFKCIPIMREECALPLACLCPSA